MNWHFVRSTLADILLATLFLVISARYAIRAWTDSWLGLDAHIYYRGSAAWLAGASPWDAVGYYLDSAQHYSALPTTVVLLAPFTLLPERVFVVLFLVVSALAALYVIRALGLPWFYLLFPPLFQGVLSGNPNIVLLALLVTGRPMLEGIGPLLKVYAGIPILLRARWKSAAWALVFGAVTLLALPLWIEFLTTFAARSSRLMLESSGGFSAFLFGPGIVGLVGLTVLLTWWHDREDGAWLAVPALWPATEFHYAALALPVLAGRWWLAALLALPVPGIPAIAPALVLLEIMFRQVRGRLGGPAPDQVDLD
jgi:hypothetical protein